MIPDAEIISLVCMIFRKLDVGEFTIKASCFAVDRKSCLLTLVSIA